jgi:two-component system sensor histidine kinase AtoS
VTTRRALSLPVRFLLLVLIVVVAPLSLMGFWLAGTAARSGEELLRSRLRESNARVTAEMASNWLRPRSALLSFGEHPLVQQELERRGAVAHPTASDSASAPTSATVAAAPAELRDRFDSLSEAVVELTISDHSQQPIWSFSRGPTALPSFAVRLPLYAPSGGQTLGTLEARLVGDAVLGPGGGLGAALGAVVGVIDPQGGASLRGLPFDPAALESDRFEWDGETWVAERRVLLDPRLDVISAAPLAEFSASFEGAARRGLVFLLGVTLLATLLAAVLTRQMTRSLGQLAVAADGVSRGELSARVPEGGGDEVGRVAQAFNRMAESLRRTLAELSQREALVAVGSFASELAHEVRNPLTAIKVDLQYVEEQLPEGSEARSVQRAALEEVVRLDRTVTGVLQVARSGRIDMEPVDVREPLRAAVRVVEPLAESAAVKLRVDTPDTPLATLGDASALQQLFTNLLVNAVQAVERGGKIDVSGCSAGEAVLVQVRDNGPGMDSEQLKRAREPFFSTKREGTGLGLAIAARIVSAHRAEMRSRARSGEGRW